MTAGPRVIGITGHTEIPPEIVDYVRDELTKTCKPAAPGLVGVSCLAAGADQMFASVVLELGGALEVVVPSREYELSFADDADRARYRELLARAAHVERLDQFVGPSAEAYLEAGIRVVDRSDLMIAVWDRAPAKGTGGTADIVAYAQQQGKPVENVWPASASRG